MSLPNNLLKYSYLNIRKLSDKFEKKTIRVEKLF